MNHNWSAGKQHLHLQGVAGISRHSALSEDSIRQCVTSSSENLLYTAVIAMRLSDTFLWHCRLCITTTFARCQQCNL